MGPHGPGAESQGRTDDTRLWRADGVVIRIPPSSHTGALPVFSFALRVCLIGRTATQSATARAGARASASGRRRMTILPLLFVSVGRASGSSISQFAVLIFQGGYLPWPYHICLRDRDNGGGSKWGQSFGNGSHGERSVLFCFLLCIEYRRQGHGHGQGQGQGQGMIYRFGRISMGTKTARGCWGQDSGRECGKSECNYEMRGRRDDGTRKREAASTEHELGASQSAPLEGRGHEGQGIYTAATSMGYRLLGIGIGIASRRVGSGHGATPRDRGTSNWLSVISRHIT